MDLYADLPLAKGAASAALDADGKLKTSSSNSVWTATAVPAFVPQVMRNANTRQQDVGASASARPPPVVTTSTTSMMLPAALRTKSPNAATPPAAPATRGISLAFKPASLTRKSPVVPARTAAAAASMESAESHARSGIGFGFAAVTPAIRIQPTAAPATSTTSSTSTTSGTDADLDPDQDDSIKSQQSALGAGAGFHATYRDEYDPARPNSYEAYCEERVARKKLELVKRELDRRQREQEREGKLEREQLVRDIEAGTAPAAQLSAAGRGRGMTVPAWMRKKMEESAAAKSAAPVTQNTVIAHVDADQFDDAAPRTGLGFAAASASLGVGTTDLLHPAAHTDASKSDIRERDESRGCVILLQNMVGPDEVDDELQDEVKDECEEKYGPVAACVVYQVPAAMRVAPEHAVRIFVQFKRSSDAESARLGLNARFFGGRKVQAALYDDDRFRRRDLAA